MLKRLFTVLMALTLITTTGLSVNGGQALAATHVQGDLYTKNNMTIMLNGSRLQLSDPILNKNGHTLLPMRALYEAVGAQIEWNKASQTAKAIKNGTTIELTINSSSARVNNQRVALTAPSIMYKNRTYVPLRFVIENFDGTVNYNHQAQLITISTTGSSQPPVSGEPYTLHLNNQRIQMEESAIIRNGRNYIPAKYFYNYLENSSVQWLDSQTVELQIEGLVFTFRNNQSNILVNQEPTASNEVPFLVGNEMYVPVHFIVNALGGNLRFRSDTNEIYIYLNQFMFSSEFLPKQEGSLRVPDLVPEAELVGDRQLLVSDNPETLTPSLIPPAPRLTLSEQRVTPDKEQNDHRVFGWHLNQLGTKVNIGITIENTSETESLTIPASSGIVKKSNNSWVNYDIGLPIADGVLNNRQQTKSSQGLTIAPGETAIIDEFELYPRYIVGFLNDFTVQTSGDDEYIIRTVLSEFEDLTSIRTEPIQINPYAAHPRGAWPASDLAATLPEYTIGSVEQGYNLSNGRSDHLLTAENSLSTTNGAIGNPGHFGMTYHVTIPLVNQTSRAATVRLKATGRGGLYSGAIKVNGESHLIPTLKPNQDYVELIDYRVEPGTDEITVEIMHAGGAALPVALYIETIR
ncbi:copper amine oxidase N-terminal domain-containing protein [Alkalihalobacillus oceani]|uniref:Copper amine oxidase N-terminal domain-containing protein n=1 Tax=Halalkalibacter oceani TaxID=1653776 RepID=A0A9X2DVS0_9BACI|nr:copper amine oxidase N-terminal domain-containing protein [Halalkalibacter oceani]MCM3716427.1 copper amine oxidase N-terminal domain-containing protein [Halalkalibacter oceani]